MVYMTEIEQKTGITDNAPEKSDRCRIRLDIKKEYAVHTAPAGLFRE